MKKSRNRGRGRRGHLPGEGECAASAWFGDDRPGASGEAAR